MLILGPNTYNENETIAKYEIMDGAPVRGKSHSSLFCNALWLSNKLRSYCALMKA